MIGSFLFVIESATLYRWKMAIVSCLAVLLIDSYIFRALQTALSKRNKTLRLTGYSVHGLITFTMLITMIWYRLADPLNHYSTIREWIVGIVLVVYGSKLIAAAVIFIDDARRIFAWIRSKLKPEQQPVDTTSSPLSRSEFLMKTAVVAGAVPFSIFSMGILSGAHDYRVRKRTILLPDLPRALDGLRIGQISDIHAGTLFNKTAVQGGVDLLLKEKPDVIFFTGDLVNYFMRELNDYASLFSTLKAPLGVFSVTGNHDYGDYNWWPNDQAKQEEFQRMIAAHQYMGYHLLRNENHILQVDHESLAVIGVENWSLKKDKRYGNIDLAVKGTEDIPVKLLLSHDPTHWDAEVRTRHPEIQVTFSGHTHGGQCGIEVGAIQWSPSQYRFKQWADLYKEGSQYLYVNRGFGCLGYPGRMGMPPELTVIELKRS